ncbi:MAG: hypothetical protein U1E13_12080, partial [Methylophilaceae bacterium]|nr:hypothetical protein [Methylophilaceae bacterium]
MVGRFDSIIEIDQEALKKKEAAKKTNQNQEENKDNEIPRKARPVLQLLPLCPASACGQPEESIVGAHGAGVHVSCHRVRTLNTSTSLSYLIVQGGVGAPHTTKRSVYALPLVRATSDVMRLNAALEKMQSELAEKKKAEDAVACAVLQKNIDALVLARRDVEMGQGLLANKHEDPRASDVFGQTPPYRFADRSFKTPATAVSDVPSVHDRAACVGGGPVPAGDITSLVVRGDSVFVTVGDPLPGQQPGVFYSQALFDQMGKIKGWSYWRRSGTWVSDTAVNEKVFSMSIDAFDQKMAVVGDAPEKITAIKRSAWSAGQKDGHALVHALNYAFEKEPAGVLGLFDFPASMPGLGDISLLAALGSRSIVFAHTGSLIDGVLVPETGDFVSDMYASDEGMLGAAGDIIAGQKKSIPAHTRVLSLCGGDLAQISPLASVEIAPYKNKSIICAAGVGGVAVLVDAAGNGFGPLAHLSQLPADMHWKKIADWPFVTKLVCDDCYLYALSDTRLMRIDLHQLDLSADSSVNQANAVTEIANVETIVGLNKQSIFTDCVISGKFAALGTSKGLVRLGNAGDIRTVSSSTAARWTPVELPESLGVVSHLLPISVTGRAQDVARQGGGMLYVLNVSVGNNKGHLVRFSVADMDNAALDSSCLQLLPDYFFKGLPAPFIDFESYKDQFFTDGSLHLVMRNRDGEDTPSIHAA